MKKIMIISSLFVMMFFLSCEIEEGREFTDYYVNSTWVTLQKEQSNEMLQIKVARSVPIIDSVKRNSHWLVIEGEDLLKNDDNMYLVQWPRSFVVNGFAYLDQIGL